MPATPSVRCNSFTGQDLANMTWRKSGLSRAFASEFTCQAVAQPWLEDGWSLNKRAAANYSKSKSETSPPQPTVSDVIALRRCLVLNLLHRQREMAAPLHQYPFCWLHPAVTSAWTYAMVLHVNPLAVGSPARPSRASSQCRC